MKPIALKERLFSKRHQKLSLRADFLTEREAKMTLKVASSETVPIHFASSTSNTGGQTIV